MSEKVVIVGTGIAGLASGIRLAWKGYEVHAFESASYPGGKLHQFSQDGFRFDAGPSLFTRPWLVDELFELASENPRNHFNYHRLEVSCHYFFEDGTRLKAFADKEKFARELEEKLGVDPASVVSYLDNSYRHLQLSGKIFLEQSLHDSKTWLTPDIVQPLLSTPDTDIFRSLHQTNTARLKHPKLVQLFNRYATYNGSDPYQTPGIMKVIPALELMEGTYLPVGGMHSITQSLFELARRVGVQFHFNARVDSIEVKHNSVTGIRTGGRFFAANMVLSNMDVVPTYRKLLAGQKAPERTLRQERSSSALVFYWGIGGSFPELHLHNIFFSEDYQAEFSHLFEKKSLFDDPTIYVNITSKLEPEDAPNGCENWFVMINAPANTGQDWDRFIKESRVRILQKLSRLLGRNIEQLIQSESVLDPRLIEKKTSSDGGSLYGTASNNKFAAFLRHKNWSSSIRGLYFAGGSAHPGGGIPLCLLSAKIATRYMPSPENSLQTNSTV